MAAQKSELCSTLPEAVVIPPYAGGYPIHPVKSLVKRILRIKADYPVNLIDLVVGIQKQLFRLLQDRKSVV